MNDIDGVCFGQNVSETEVELVMAEKETISQKFKRNPSNEHEDNLPNNSHDEDKVEENRYESFKWSKLTDTVEFTWEQLLSLNRRLKLTKPSEEEDMREPYWQMQFLKRYITASQLTTSVDDGGSGDIETGDTIHNAFDNYAYAQVEEIIWEQEALQEDGSKLIVPTEESIRTFLLRDTSITKPTNGRTTWRHVMW
ncbi:hypothetical protein EMCG_07129 [[Emmonsia] crescens]|uniref:Uncharacterized protein n=1 Tax=[Emmonsia] crescens TaxID=73230 RepID=A0A0G2J5Z8_9EURO|nr:hypothetical protein EMCG_07129 [Emmonsia crescens UAMH 3008]